MSAAIATEQMPEIQYLRCGGDGGQAGGVAEALA